KRKKDDLTPGGLNNRRPDRATIVYTNLIKSAFKKTVPIIIGGIEASCRRIAHYDYWDNDIRRSILFDSKADLLIYGMAESAILNVAKLFEEFLKDSFKPYEKLYFSDELKEKIRGLRGLCYIDKIKPPEFIEIPSFEDVKTSKDAFEISHNIFFDYINDETKQIPLIQKHNDRYLIHNPPSFSLTAVELDDIYELDFAHDAHPICKNEGKIIALDTIPFSVTTHRGCIGNCSFCSIAIHQGKKVINRSTNSILKEVEDFKLKQEFNGIVKDIGGPTANMYGISCSIYGIAGSCSDKDCLFPNICKNLCVEHKSYIELLRSARSIEKIRRVFISSGIRYDLIMADKKYQKEFLKELILYHTSGQFKIAPEHTEDHILKLMHKPEFQVLTSFLNLLNSTKEQINRSIEYKGKTLELVDKRDKENNLELRNELNNEKLYRKNAKTQIKQNAEKNTGVSSNFSVSFYLIAAYPGCKNEDMIELGSKLNKFSNIIANQVQVFIPLPLTYSSVQYYLEKDPKTDKKLFVEKNLRKKTEQKDILFI
ncbi:MAG TPA: YgiQ family radical SAM protein, partial [Exilispira sp.]|nr:YgiQ family radical SAM protein [Exilispira sp.]